MTSYMIHSYKTNVRSHVMSGDNTICKILNNQSVTNKIDNWTVVDTLPPHARLCKICSGELQMKQQRKNRSRKNKRKKHYRRTEEDIQRQLALDAEKYQ